MQTHVAYTSLIIMAIISTNILSLFITIDVHKPGLLQILYALKKLKPHLSYCSCFRGLQAGERPVGVGAVGAPDTGPPPVACTTGRGQQLEGACTTGRRAR